MAALLSLALAVGCGGPQTSVTQGWKAEVTAPVRSVLVFGVGMDETNRRTVEDTMTSELAKRHVAARPSYALFPGGAPPDRETARKLVTQGQFDAVLVATLRNVTERTTVLPGTYYGGFWNTYYGQQPWLSYDPGYVVTEQIVHFETTLWDTRAGDRLVWSADLATTNPSEGRKFATSLTDSVMSKLEDGGLVHKAD